nr:MAG TPA: hypothetical protein [Caudoviricetes sp.]
MDFTIFGTNLDVDVSYWFDFFFHERLLNG